MNVMKPSLTIFPCVLGSAFPYIRVCPGLSFATKRIGPPCCTLFTFVTCCSLQIILSQNYLLPLISVLVDNTLLETAYHFLLLLVGFDTLTYQKDYDRSPALVGHQGLSRCQPSELTEPILRWWLTRGRDLRLPRPKPPMPRQAT